jgi:hypothetical protein
MISSTSCVDVRAPLVLDRSEKRWEIATLMMQIHRSAKNKNEEAFILPRSNRRGCTLPPHLSIPLTSLDMHGTTRCVTQFGRL